MGEHIKENYKHCKNCSRRVRKPWMISKSNHVVTVAVHQSMNMVVLFVIGVTPTEENQVKTCVGAKERKVKMGINVELAKKAEKVAKRLAKNAGMSESLWEIYLIEAYKEVALKKVKDKK